MIFGAKLYRFVNDFKLKLLSGRFAKGFQVAIQALCL